MHNVRQARAGVARCAATLSDTLRALGSAVVEACKAREGLSKDAENALGCLVSAVQVRFILNTHVCCY